MANLPALTPTTFGEAMQFAEALAKSTMVPREYQRMPANILVAIQWGAELGLGPLQALQNIAVINGKPSVYGDAMLALVRGSALCEDVVEHVEGEGDSRAAVCEARRKGSAPVVARFSVQDAKLAGLWDKQGPWKQYPLRMLQMRARGFALRDAFPDILRGVISAEEAADHPREMKDVTPPTAATLAAELDDFAVAVDDVEPDQAETDELLVAARTRALDGWAGFGNWYLDELTDDQRLMLRPHMKELRAAARRVDGIKDESETPHPQPPVADHPREEVDPRNPTPPEGAPPSGIIDGGATEELEVVKPQRLKRGGWDWPRYADELIAAGRRTPISQLGRWRGANSQMFEALRVSNKDAWSRASQALADYERDGTA